jgi:precorrin-8X/cobalt-precorrin-8 methylmutase
VGAERATAQPIAQPLPITLPSTDVDVIIIVDWSASSTPTRGADSIWSYELATAAGNDPRPPINHRTRHAATVHIESRLRASAGQRVLLGFDFAFGYPAGFARAVGFTGAAPWEAIWQHLSLHITDDERNRNNRWAVATELNRRLGHTHFWGAPPRHASAHLTTTKPLHFALAEFRRSEVHLRAATGKRPFSAWQLLGIGAVGSQTLMGIPILQRLRVADRLSDRTHVWPFETGFTADPWAGRRDGIVLAEVWPSAIEFGHIGHPIKDAQRAADGSLGEAFRPLMSAADASTAMEEGWVLMP